KEATRSRIPRLVLRPQQHKVSPASESPFSEEESREFPPTASSGGSARTASSNSFCSDDTGCPSSQSVSPVKTPSDAGHSPISFCSGSDGDFARKKFHSGAMSEGSLQVARYKKETKTSLVKPGNEADFSSSSSTGSISAPEIHMSAAGSKRSSFSRNRGSYGRNNGSSSSKSASTPPISREKELLLALYRSQLNPGNNSQDYGFSSTSSSNSGSYKGNGNSPVMRQVRSGRYTSCGENHGVKAPTPEQYLTPLQQKEVTVRHLKTKLKESESKLKERETEIQELKAQLGRMREDWIEEECHRVEAQLALKEAKKEIKQLKQVIETMKDSLAEKDKGIQKYFVDINIQNKKLESLLHSMEMAQSGSLRDEQGLDYMCDSPEKSVELDSRTPESPIVEEQEALQGAEDSGLLLSEDKTNGTDSYEEGSTTTTSDLGDQILFSSAGSQEVLENVPDEKSISSLEREESSNDMIVVEQAIQTDVVPCNLDVKQLIRNILRPQEVTPVNPPFLMKELDEFPSESLCDSGVVIDLTPSDPNSAILLSPVEPACSEVDYEVNENRVMKELDFIEPHGQAFGRVNTFSQTGIAKRYWSSNVLVDLLAVAAPVVPTIMWAFSTQRGGIDPMYNIGALLRGCCLVALHSLRRVPFKNKT
ncbi:SYBU protein, partial [Crypturellus soui]|nr:SYBU protein [Crypturellus soui]